MTEPRSEQVVVLAGGLGTRLGPMGADRPKVLQDVLGRPFLDVMLEPVAASGLRRFHFCLGHLAPRVAAHLATLPAEWETTAETEPAPLGTAGALLHSVGHLDEQFMVLLGDTYLDTDYGGLFDRFPPDSLGMMLLTRASNDVLPNVGVRDGTVTAYDKNGVPGGLTDTGVTLLRRSALDVLQRARERTDLHELFHALMGRGALAAAVTGERFFDIGTPRRHQALATHLSAGTAKEAGI
ncbi:MULTISPECIES: sugar phosphate nucleotidyltransferase [Nocardiopsidaceae]|uniref:Sugar phosphate nucleotidyltransferase n=1 Tax=Streptomonospora nanhaiensis TaxID=1323731 RepID=A0ABY6YP92_9ACTN|nr:sugar phosphate nucleotidyltransferase [Streptomonospora nanhaiensis]WAE74043.1 sugar phosphate nucleotidyltransferase [Streptomonospora nanhaiensis]